MKSTPYAVTLALFAAASPLFAQANFSAVNVTPAGANAVANAVYSGISAGGLLPGGGNPALASHAAIFDGLGNATDLHPSFLDTAVILGRSAVNAAANGIQVGTGTGGVATRPSAILWNNTSSSALILPTPFVHYGATASATDGTQIVGRAQTFTTKRELVQFGPLHALLWDATGATVTDLHPGGSGSIAQGVGGGKQVGYILKPTASAVMWSGSAKTMVSLHPLKDFDASQANATDGAQQVGSGGMFKQVFFEKRGRRVRFEYALRWTGTAASVQMLDLGGFRDTYALAVSGSTICGYGTIGTVVAVTGTHAVAWTGPNRIAVDLHTFLPAGYTNSQATGVDATGNISGWAITATGQRHAFVWSPIP